MNSTTLGWVGFGLVLIGGLVTQYAAHVSRSSDDERMKAALANELLVNYSRLRRFWAWANRSVEQTEQNRHIVRGEGTHVDDYRILDAMVPELDNAFTKNNISAYVTHLESGDAAGVIRVYERLKVFYVEYDHLRPEAVTDEFRKAVWPRLTAEFAQLTEHTPKTGGLPAIAVGLYPPAEVWLKEIDDTMTTQANPAPSRR